MSFKDQIQNDLDVFLNPLEFGDTHLIDNQEVTVVVDNDLINQEGSNREIFQDSIVFAVNKTDLPGKPKIKQMMNFDGKTYRVADVIDEAGMYTVTLKGNTSR